jgi:hypothetical protein
MRSAAGSARPKPLPAGERPPAARRRVRGRRSMSAAHSRREPAPPPWTLPAVIWSFLYPC